jgi:hypothetical protein
VEREEIIEKIRKLLRLSESPNEHEAALAATKARELLSSYNLSLADLSIEDILQKLGIVEIPTSTYFKIEEWVQALAFHIARIFDCRVLGWGSLSEIGRIVFVGTPSDAEVAIYTFEFLRRSVDEMAKDAIRTLREERKGIDEATYRQTYLIGAVQRIREEMVLRSLVFKKKEQNECTAVVLHKKENLDKYLNEKYPHIETSETTLFDLDRESFYRGYAQAKGLQVNIAIKEGN